MSKVAAVTVAEQPDKFELFQNAMFLASNAFLNVHQLLLILREEVDRCGSIDRERVVAIVQIGIDLTHMQGELVEKEAEAFHEVRRG
jgi:hypothetical protein